ncbi:MAG: glycosyltransferase family 2 protein [Phycisphaerales bacterium]|nr:MAG: glycosyltransferase family 2 protein [Phycisphaerales bacterium]
MIDLSVVAPAHNEQENVRPLVEEITAAIDPLGLDYEIVIVDDGSTDRTGEVLREMLSEQPTLRVIRMADTPPDRGNGQSAAFHAGFRAARGRLIAVLDADLQNDPADLPAMLEMMEKTAADMVHGDRSQDRRDTIGRRAGSLVGRLFRRWLLGDTIRDTGCSLRIMRREVALAIPLQFRGMHRFVPVTARQLGYKVVETTVHHRPRVAGQAKYGVWNRAIPGLFDCLAVRWMRNRRRPVRSEEITLPDKRQGELTVTGVGEGDEANR